MNTLQLAIDSKTYWSEELNAPLPGFNMYTDYPKHLAAREMQSNTFILNIDTTRATGLRGISPMNAFMLTSYVVFLLRMSNEKDVIVGVQNKEGQLLPLRVMYKGDETFQQLNELITKKLELSSANAIPLDEIAQITHSSIHFQTLYGNHTTYEHSCLNWYVQEKESQWKLHVAYHKNLFKEQTIHKFVNHYEQIVNAALANMDIAIGSIPILTEVDLEAYISLNNTSKELPINPTIVHRFAEIVTSFPHRIAISSDQQQLTYEQLNSLSNKVAHMLIKKGLQKGDFVAIFMERSIETIISLMGVMKAGGAYIPLDPEHPDERNAYIIDDTQCSIIITKDALTSKISLLLGNHYSEKEIFSIDKQLNLYSEVEYDAQVEPDDLAYIIYTSGSTGKPKGALIAHKGVINLAIATRDSLDVTEKDIFLQYSTFSFDASVYDVFGSMMSGSQLHLLSNEQRFSIESFTDAVVATKATRIAILPTVFFNQLSAYLRAEDVHKYQQIKSIVVGGEALSGETIRLFQKKLGLQINVVNAYGPTECTVVTTTHLIDYVVPDDLSAMYIGTPINNYELYIVNEKNALCPINVVGELLISSIGIAQGYLNQPDKTREAFISDPIDPDSYKRFYRSGDLVRLLENGQVEYIGRKDSQVKIRGYRIEIGEIEDNFAKYDFIKDVAIIPKTDDDGTKMLVAFYTSKDHISISKPTLVEFLTKKLPAYMIPKHIVFLENMPISPTGKIDRKHLATLEMNSEPSDSNYFAPESKVQLAVASAWEQAMNRTQISIHDQFFDIGGHSLKILEILVILKPQFSKLKINDFFMFPTIAQLSARIEDLIDEEVIEQISQSDEQITDLYEFPAVFQDGLQFSCNYTQLHILLTGATGYLGSHLLYELLHKSQATIYCLVRTLPSQDPYERLVSVMTDYFGRSIVQLMMNRVHIITGDLEQDDLGISRADQALLHDRIDSIIHCGAEVKHFGDAAYFTKVNVDSTGHLLALAKRNKNTRFHYISTLGIPEDLALSDQWEQFISQSKYDETVQIDNVYTNSKLEAEKLVVRTSEEDNIPATIYRVGNLSCNSINGSFQKNINNNAFYRMLKAMILLKKAPKVNWQVDITPIDYAGKSITTLALHSNTIGRVFHICNPEQIYYEQMIHYFKEYGYEITLMELEDYEAWLLDTQKPKNQVGLELAMAQLEGDGAKHSSYRYTCPQTLQFLSDSNVDYQTPNKPFFDKLIDFAVHIGYFDSVSSGG